ncbi:MAG: zinc-ribbon domain-containing protein [Deltaproteobacteria bacterium]|nr:zinc-ribbon domain-containing protein [Deltaproteobacteria bacterium]
MIITCKECNANFKLDENLLKPTGSKVRCSKCNEIFTAYPPKISEEVEAPIEMAIDIEDQQFTEDLDADKKEMTDPDEFDFSEIDNLIDDEEAPEIEDITDEDTEDLELDLDLEPETKRAKEDLEAKVDQEDPDEFDLSDLENLLNEQEEEISESTTDETFEDLDLEIMSETDVSVEKAPPSAEPEEIEELDLSDLEEILDLDDPMTEEESVPDDIELELDMEMEPELEKMPEGGDAEDLEEVDLSEIEKMLEIEEETEAIEEPIEGDMELELDMEEAPADTPLPEDSSQVEVYELDEADDALDEPEAVGAAATEEPEFEVGESEDEVVDEAPLLEETTSAKERRVSKPLVVLLILALLAGGSYGTYVVLDFMNIEIPFISDYLKPKVSDPAGSLKIDTLDVNSKFLLNVKDGKLFVITGRVKNGYPDVRRFISINGRLYKKGKILVQTETVFCGNFLSDIELSNIELEAIKKRLSNRFGDNKSNMQINPGGELPFMLIFSNLPDDLEEFSIEVAGSTSG